MKHGALVRVIIAIWSRPAGARGLKLPLLAPWRAQGKSRPAGARGLKLAPHIKLVGKE